MIDNKDCKVSECDQARHNLQNPTFCWKQYLLSSKDAKNQDKGVEVRNCPWRRILSRTYPEPFQRAKERRSKT